MNTESADILNRLRAHPFLKGVSEAHLHSMMDCAMPTAFAAEQRIFAEGDVANRFYLLESGEVTLLSEKSPHEHVVVQTLGAGDVLGWSWLFPPYYWHFSAIAKTPVNAIFFYGTRLRERCDQDPALGYEVMKRVSEIVIARLQKARQEFSKA